MGEKNVVLLSWDQSGPAYEAFSKFRDLDTATVGVESSAVVERLPDGQLRITDGQDNVVGLGTLGGGSLGALIGVLGGPLGMLLGFAGGGLIGSIIDLDRDTDSDSVIGALSQALPPRRTGIIAEVDEQSPQPIDEFAQSTGATLLRRNEDEVLDEIAAAEDAADAAREAADHKIREAKKAERKENWEERIDKIKKSIKDAF